MTALERLQQMISKLSPEELAQLRAWILEQDWSAWDQQIEADVRTGKLDALADEALREHESSTETPPLKPRSKE